MATSNIARTEESDQNVSLLASLPFQVIDDGCLRHPSLESREIRLVTLLRGNSNEQLECRMENFRIDQCHYYEALSYVWGDNSELNPLRVNNAWFQITRNLFEALHQLRSSDRDRSLWIDQLCIDQTDLDERAAQYGTFLSISTPSLQWVGLSRDAPVEMMGDIYKQANQVLCWLGPDGDEEADLASDLIQEMLRADLDIHAEGVIRLSGGYGNIDDTILKEINLPVLASRKWTALNHLIQHPYFERVWIMQEVKLASSKILLWGDSELSWDDLLKVLPWGLNIGTHALLEDSLLDLDAITRVLSLAEKTTTFEQCLAAAAVRKSTVAVDKIFAILNLVEGGAPFPADYNRTLLEAYRYTSMNLLQNRGNLKFMSHIDNSFINENDFHDWPSWVPRTWKGVKGPGEPDFTASSRFPLYTFLLEIDTSYLTLRGVKEGNVKIIGSAISSKPNRSNNGNDYQTDLETTALKIAEAWDLLRKHAKSFRDPGEPLFKAFIRTLVSGLFDLKPTALENAKHNNVNMHQNILNDLYLDFTKFWCMILSAYLGFKGTSAVPFVRKNLALLRTAILTFLDVYEDESHTEIDGKAELLQKLDDDKWEEFGSKFLSSPANDGGVLFGTAATLTDIDSLLEANFSKRLRDLPEIMRVAEEIGLSASVTIGRPNSFTKMWREVGLKRRFFITDTGSFGMGPVGMREDDVTAVLFGGSVPFVLRPVEDGEGYDGDDEGNTDGTIQLDTGGNNRMGEVKKDGKGGIWIDGVRPQRYKVIGSCYLHGEMHGELVDWFYVMDAFSGVVELFRLV